MPTVRHDRITLRLDADAPVVLPTQVGFFIVSAAAHFDFLRFTADAGAAQLSGRVI